MQQRIWRVVAAAVLLTTLAAPMALRAQTPMNFQMQGGMNIETATSPATKDSIKPDSAKSAEDSAKILKRDGGQGMILNGPVTPASKDSTKADAGDCAASAGVAVGSAGKQNGGPTAGGVIGMGGGSCDQKKSDSTAAPGR